jgi:alanine racemase
MADFLLNRVEIDLAALRQNYLEMQAKVGKGTEVMAMVKADAYGHGLLPAARSLLQAGARIFGVADLEEGIILRRAGLPGEIILLLGAPEEGFPEVIAHQLSLVVFELAAVEKLSRLGEQAGVRVDIHLKVDVGMGRVGIMPAEVPSFLEKVARMSGVRLAGVMSHLPMADRPADARTGQHCRNFAAIIQQLRADKLFPAAGGGRPFLHLANSAALCCLPQTHFDMVRPGIALYGCQPGGESSAPAPLLKPVMSFKSRVLQLKEVPAGYGLSYGHTFVADQPSRLAILPVGYADGYLRRLSNRAVVLIRGRRVPLRGTICMNACIADVTGLPEVQVGDEVVLLGRQGCERIEAQELADWLGTIHYEVLCLLGSRNTRVYVNSDQRSENNELKI